MQLFKKSEEVKKPSIFKKIKTISMWSFLKWVILTLFIFYVGFSVMKDVKSLTVAVQVQYNSDKEIDGISFIQYDSRNERRSNAPTTSG